LKSGLVPDLPSSGWRVNYSDALHKWLGTKPSLHAVPHVVAWIRDCERDGPPEQKDGAIEDEGDWWFAIVPGTKLTATWLLIAHEYNMNIKRFG
jgi:hypothetical protein